MQVPARQVRASRCVSRLRTVESRANFMMPDLSACKVVTYPLVLQSAA